VALIAGVSPPAVRIPMRFIVGRNKCSLFRVLPRHLFPMHPSGALVKTQIKWLARSRILKRCGDRRLRLIV
jgi:hypothetical protein